jgi:hypothetical protein
MNFNIRLKTHPHDRANNDKLHQDKAARMRGGKREGTGGAMPGAGRKPDRQLTKPRAIRLTDRQAQAYQDLGGSPWLQGILNLEIRKQENLNAE